MDFQKNFKAAERRRKLRERAIAHKGGCCRICGYNACLAALDLHHVYEDTKEFNISSKMTSWSAIVSELEKTELLCCRCHREVHAGMHIGFLQFDDRGGDRNDD